MRTKMLGRLVDTMGKRRVLVPAVAAFALVVLAGTAEAAFVEGVTLEFPDQGQNSSRTRVNMINGDGFDPVNLTHNTQANGDMWRSSVTAVSPAAPIVVTFDLQSSMALESMHIWNHNHGNASFRDGVETMDVLMSDDGENFTAVLEGLTLQNGTGSDDYTGEAIALGGASGRYVRFNITGGYNEGAGLSEVRFTEVPEPASLALLGLSGLAVLGRRRRR